MSAPRLAVLAAVIWSSLLVSSCITRSYSDSIEVKGGTREEKLRIADSVVNEERLRLLRTQVKAVLPNVTDADLANLRLQRSEQELPESTATRPASEVHVVIAIQLDGARDPKPIVNAATEILRPEIGSQERRHQ